jgi:hypothetical protein
MQPAASSRNRGRIVGQRERERASPRVILIIIIIIISEQKTSSPVLSTMNRLEKERERE